MNQMPGHTLERPDSMESFGSIFDHRRQLLKRNACANNLVRFVPESVQVISQKNCLEAVICAIP
jgi:hypothetical protein